MTGAQVYDPFHNWAIFTFLGALLVLVLPDLLAGRDGKAPLAAEGPAVGALLRWWTRVRQRSEASSFHEGSLLGVAASHWLRHESFSSADSAADA